MAEKTAASCIAGAQVLLDHAYLGLTDYLSGGERRQPGLYAAVTSGRSVTWAIQNMRGHVEGFEEWYAEVQASLKADPVCRWFMELRNQIEKQGTHGRTAKSGSITNLNDDWLSGAPPGTYKAFISDELNRSGFHVRLPDDSEVVVYTAPPAGVDLALHFEDAPDDRDVGDLLAYYLERLKAMIAAARQVFLGDAA